MSENQRGTHRRSIVGESPVDRRHFLSRSAMALGALGVPGLFAACGDDDEPAAKGGASASTMDAKLQLIWIRQNQFAGYYIAQEKGWYDEAGLNLDITPGGPDIIADQVLSTGRADFAVTFVASALSANEKGADLVNIFQVWQAAPTGLVCRRDEGIETPADLKGKTVSTFLGPNQFPFFSILRAAGLDPRKDVKLVGQALGMDPFKQGQVDCASGANYNEHVQIYTGENALTEDQVVTFSTQEFGEPFVEDGAYMQRERLESEEGHEVAVRFVMASMRGWDWAFKNPEEATAIVLSGAGQGIIGEEHQLNQLKVIRDENVQRGTSLSKGIGYLDPDLLQRNYDGAIKYEILEEEQDLSRFYTHDVWDEATKRLQDRQGLTWSNGELVEA